MEKEIICTNLVWKRLVHHIKNIKYSSIVYNVISIFLKLVSSWVMIPIQLSTLYTMQVKK